MQVDEGVVRLQDMITQLQKCDNLPAETEKAVERARALIKDSASSRQVCTHYRFCVIKTGMWLCTWNQGLLESPNVICHKCVD